MLGTDWDDWRVRSRCSLKEILNLSVILLSDTFLVEDKINLILEDDDMSQLHDINCTEMLGSLWLWAIHISSDQK